MLSSPLHHWSLQWVVKVTSPIASFCSHGLYEAVGMQHPRWGGEETSTCFSSCGKQGEGYRSQTRRVQGGDREQGPGRGAGSSSAPTSVAAKVMEGRTWRSLSPSEDPSGALVPT